MIQTPRTGSAAPSEGEVNDVPKRQINTDANRVSRYSNWKMRRSQQVRPPESRGLCAYRQFLNFPKSERLRKQLRDPDYAMAMAAVFRGL